MTAPRLVVFDVDGTLVDSQAHILASMDHAFAVLGRPPPPRAEVLGIVGLSLPVAMARLAPDVPEAWDRLVAAYKDAFASMRASGDGSALSPLYPGALSQLQALAADPWTLMGVATGKSRRGLDHLFTLHDLASFFQTVQVADNHPSKPAPSMLEACLRDTGVSAERAVIVGDTTFDMEMGRAAGMACIGVSWGYHAVEHLRASGAGIVIEHFDALPAALDRVLSTT